MGIVTQKCSRYPANWLFHAPCGKRLWGDSEETTPAARLRANAGFRRSLTCDLIASSGECGKSTDHAPTSAGQATGESGRSRIKWVLASCQYQNLTAVHADDRISLKNGHTLREDHFELTAPILVRSSCFKRPTAVRRTKEHGLDIPLRYRRRGRANFLSAHSERATRHSSGFTNWSSGRAVIARPMYRLGVLGAVAYHREASGSY
jgi:hypothetical protein